MYRTDFWTLWEKARVGCFKRTASKHVYYLGWNRSPDQVGCMRQVLRPGALGRPRGIGWRGRWEAGSGWGIHVYPRLIHVNVWQNPLQYCKVISLQLIKRKKKRKKKREKSQVASCPWLPLDLDGAWGCFSTHLGSRDVQIGRPSFSLFSCLFLSFFLFLASHAENYKKWAWEIATGRDHRDSSVTAPLTREGRGAERRRCLRFFHFMI